MSGANSAVMLLSLWLATACAQAQAAAPAIVAAPASSISDEEVSNAYIYLLGRLLVLRQQRLDFEQEGMEWNRLVHRERGGVSWPNPNLDVVYSEAWVAVDEQTCVALEIPRITGRYYTWHMLNGWGETVLNINERTYPQQPFGRYALCLKGAKATVPAGTLRVDLPARTARVLARVELGSDAEEAVRLQHLFRLEPLGHPKVAPRIDVPLFTLAKLPGAEAFDDASAILASEPDINPGMEPLQALVRGVQALVRSGPDGRSRVEEIVREQTMPGLRKQFAAMGQKANGWARVTPGNYASDYAVRTAVDLSGIWANNTGEYVPFAARRLEGGMVYTQTFPKDALPGSKVRYFWSVTAVDSQQYRVIANPIGRHLLSSQSALHYNADGSLTLVYAARKPEGVPESNWLPIPAEGKFNLGFRFYGADKDVLEGRYYPPPLVGAQ